jgi:hypothetical protein
MATWEDNNDLAADDTAMTDEDMLRDDETSQEDEIKDY